MTDFPLPQIPSKHSPGRGFEAPPLEAFWGSGDEAKALIRECQHFLNSRAQSPASGQLPSPPDPLRKPRRPSIRKLVEQAEKAGKTVTSITTPDGTKLDFGRPAPPEPENPWLADLRKETKQ